MSERLQIVMAGTADHDLTKLAGYRAVGGYEALYTAAGLSALAGVVAILSVRRVR